jgi:Ser/Thr protein kinase RdoA (MazF antagonist)
MDTRTMTDAVPYDGLGPATVLEAVESTGLLCDGRLLALNSYENRVYQVGIEDGQPLVVKFYRPGRWEDEAILEEHGFAHELLDHDIPVVAPLAMAGRTLHSHGGFRFALYPRRGGRLPDLDMPDHRLWMGRFLGRMHAVGEVRGFEHRPELSIRRFGREPLEEILRRKLVPGYMLEAYVSVAEDVLTRIQACWDRAGAVPMIRLHGDCHAGNVLWTDTGPHFVDLDDAVTGPPLQDLWMLLAGDRREMTEQLSEVLEGYEDFQEFDRRQLHLLEALRSLRMLNHSAWLARRWDDPAFPLAFPWFGESRYWEEQVLALREQTALLDEPPLQV